MDYRPHGVCSQMIRVEVENDIVTNVQFLGGCAGNTKGVASLVKGMDVHEAISRLEGITCGMKPTSCPDQLAKALKLAIAK
ncbi:MAG: TIGR03905 family TSCPD domain-containing protein [Dorea sp.]